MSKQICKKCGSKLESCGSLDGMEQMYCPICDVCKNCGTITDRKTKVDCVFCNTSYNYALKL